MPCASARLALAPVRWSSRADDAQAVHGLLGASPVPALSSIFCKRKIVACRTLALPCHNTVMVDFAIMPRGGVYWIEALRKDGSRRPIERFDTEDAAVTRLRVLQAKAELRERQMVTRPASMRSPS